MRKKLVGPGVLGFDRLKGKEERRQDLSDTFSINAIAHAVNIVGEMSQQRVPWPLRRDCYDQLSAWIKERVAIWCANQLCGNVNAGLGAVDQDGNLMNIAAGDFRYTGMNAPIAPSTFIFPNTNITAESQLTTAGVNGANLFNLFMLNRAVTKAKTLKFPVKPIMVGEEPYWVCILHSFQVNDLKNQTGEGTWENIQLARIQGGNPVSENPLMTGAVGMYNRSILHDDIHVAFGDTTQNTMGTALGAVAAGATSVARAPFFGAQAAVMAYGRKTSWPNQMKWVEESDDYMRELGVALELVAGLKKSVFSDTTGTAFDFGTMTLSTFATVV